MTTPQPTPYTEAMRSVRLSEEEKAQLKAVLSQRDSSIDPLADNPGAPAPARALEPDRSRRPRAPRRLAAILLAAALTLGAAGLAAAATSGGFDVEGLFTRMFGMEPSETPEEAGLISRPLAACTTNGVTIALETVVDDGNLMSCVFRITDADGGIPEPLRPVDGIPPNIHFALMNAEMRPVGGEESQEPALGYGSSASTTLLDTADGPALYVTVGVTIDRPVGNGQALTITLIDMIDSSFNPLHEGTWAFEFTTSKLSSLVEFDTSASFSHEARGERLEATATHVSVSPFSLEVEYEIPNYQPLGEDGLPVDLPISLIPMAVVLTDGFAVSQTDPKGPHGGNLEWHGGSTGDNTAYGHSIITFSQLIDPADVVAVQIGDATIPVP